MWSEREIIKWNVSWVRTRASFEWAAIFLAEWFSDYRVQAFLFRIGQLAFQQQGLQVKKNIYSCKVFAWSLSYHLDFSCYQKKLIFFLVFFSSNLCDK